MKRFHKALLTAAACAALLISAQAAEPQDVLQTVLPAVQQEWQSTGTVSTTYFSGDDYLMQLSSLVPEKHLYTVILLMKDTSDASIYKCGVFDPQTGKMVVPLEYDSIEATPDGELLLGQWDDDSPRYWFADAAGALMQIELPAGYTDLLPDRSGLFILSKLVLKPMTDVKMPETTEENVTQYAIADRDMNIIRDNIDGGVSGPSIWPPEYTNGVFIIQTGSTQWEYGTAYSSCNGTFGLIDKTGNWISILSPGETENTTCLTAKAAKRPLPYRWRCTGTAAGRKRKPMPRKRMTLKLVLPIRSWTSPARSSPS